MAENMEKGLTVWQNIQRWIDAMEDPNRLPTRAYIVDFYNIKYNTFWINGLPLSYLIFSLPLPSSSVVTFVELYLPPLFAVKKNQWPAGISFSDSCLNTLEIFETDVINLCILLIICNCMFFSQWPKELGPCRITTSSQNNCSDTSFITGITVHIIAIKVKCWFKWD